MSDEWRGFCLLLFLLQITSKCPSTRWFVRMRNVRERFSIANSQIDVVESAGNRDFVGFGVKPMSQATLLRANKFQVEGFYLGFGGASFCLD